MTGYGEEKATGGAHAALGTGPSSASLGFPQGRPPALVGAGTPSFTVNDTCY